MADEIQVRVGLTIKNGGLNKQINDSFSVTQAAVGGPTPGYVTIGTTEESQAFSELTTLGWVHIKNLDTTNYVQWGFATGAYGGRLEPGETATFRLEPSTTMYFVANTAACKCLIEAFED